MRFRHAILALLLSSASAVAGDLARSPETLYRLVRSSKAKTVEELLAKLDPHLLSNYSLVVASRSTQSGSYQGPRVTLYDKHGGFYLTFTDAGADRGANTIEMIKLSPEGKPAQFGRVVFGGEGGPKFLKNGEQELCLRCHSSHPKFPHLAKLEGHTIWEGYPDWPDRYGASHLNYMGAGASQAKESPLMAEQFKLFQAKAATDPRYRHLVGLQGKDLMILGAENTRLGDTILQQNLRRAAQVIAENPAYEKYEKSLRTRIFDNDRKFIATLSKADRAEFKRQGPERKQKIEAQMRKYYDGKVARYAKTSGLESRYYQMDMPQDPSFDGSWVYNMETNSIDYRARIDFVLEKMGIDPEILNFTLERGSYSASQGGVNIDHLVEKLEEARAAISAAPPKPAAIAPGCEAGYKRLD